MSASGSAQIESLNGENYDTWRIQMEALLVRNDKWEYVSGECAKPELVEGDAKSEERSKAWTKNDNKAKSEIILSINPSQLREIKGCDTSREVWLKLEEVHRSKETLRKVTLLKQLILQRMEDADDAREHVREFFDAIEKLSEMDVDINLELLTIMLLYSLPSSFESLRCEIESRDELPLPEELSVIIIEESDARRNETLGETRNAAIAKKYCTPNKNNSKKKSGNGPSDKKDEFKYRCHRCKEVGHKATDCKNKKLHDIGRTVENVEIDTRRSEDHRYDQDDPVVDTRHEEDDGNHCLEEIPRRGPARPEEISTGQSGIPRKQYRIRYVHNEYWIMRENVGKIISETEAQEWFRAMAVEVKSILKNDTWLLVDRPENQQKLVHESHMLLRNKHKPDGSLDRREAHVSTKHYDWVRCLDGAGIILSFDFRDGSFSVPKRVRISMALAAHYGMKIKHFDLRRGYLNCKIDKEELMETPEYLTEALEIIIGTEKRDSDLRTKAMKMLIELKSGDKVCLLKKTPDGIQQHEDKWSERLDEFLKRFGAKPSKAVPDLYFLDQGEDMLLIFACVDQIIVASRNQSKITKLMDSLTLEFKTDDLGDIEYFRGMQFTRSGRTVTINQRGFIRDLLDRFGMAESTPVTTPMDVNGEITPCNDDENKSSYDELMNALMYLSVCTRPDITYAVEVLMETYNQTAAKRILRYLKGTTHFGPTFGPATQPPIGYVGTSNPGDQSGIFNYMLTFGNGPIVWCPYDSSFSSESDVFERAIGEAIDLRSVLMELGVGLHFGQVKFLCNDVGALEHPRSFRYRIDFFHNSIEYRSIRHALDYNQLKIEQVHIDDTAVAPLIKALPEAKHKRCVELLGLGSIDIDQN